MEPSKMCYDLIKHQEGLIPPQADGLYHAYHGKKDRPGVWTIGYGVTWYPKGKAVRDGDKGDLNDCEMWLEWHVNRFADIIDSHLPKGDTFLNQNQFDSLVDFTYNEGEGNLFNSTLWKKVLKNPNDSTIFNVQMPNGIPQVSSCEFMKYVFAAGVVVDDLVYRRATECILYSTGRLDFLGH